ncbi:MAG TPA: minichromosome maintenance protein MCM [Candidatus Aenigmarchaeota archaeon]|nr:minichromosome maintenance protein MCM [Candidatus Aenigmarchaeota archaeon]
MNANFEDIILEFLKSKEENLIFASTNKQPFIIDYFDLDKFNPELAEELLDKPEETLDLFYNCLKEFDVKIAVQFRNLPEKQHIRIRDLRIKHLNKFIIVEGIVKIASEIKPRIYETIYECQECGTTFSQEQAGATIVKPLFCKNCGRRGSFKLIEKKMYDSRWLTIQEPFEITYGEKPGEIKVFLKKELTIPEMQRKTDPGNRIFVIGILKELPRKIHGREATQSDIYIEANYVELAEQDIEEIEISEVDERKILELSKDPKLYDKLVNSLAPSIYGNKEIKEAILLQLFGGTPLELPDGTTIRGNIHILLVGDPATAKSQLLKLTSKLIPRSRYVSGKGVTGAGLISTVRKDEFTGGWVLEAGALVLCNKGLIAIDEFEKMNREDQVAMHEALEQGSVSIAKASIVATLPAQTSVLAGANPKLGRFDIYTAIADQITIPQTLLSRFDLKFAMRDIPNAKEDEKLVDHVLTARKDLKLIEPEIPHSLLRKYIAYAKQTIKQVTLSDTCLKELKKFFINLRSIYTEEDRIVPITFRQFEGLMRLAQASAKLNLRREATKEDAKRAIRIMQYSLKQLGFDVETGKMDIDRVESAIAGTQRSKIRILLDIIDNLEKEMKEVPIEDLGAQAEENGIVEWQELIQKMKREGLLYEPKSGYIKKV